MIHPNQFIEKSGGFLSYSGERQQIARTNIYNAMYGVKHHDTVKNPLYSEERPEGARAAVVQSALFPSIHDYDSMCTIIQSFILTKQLYDDGVQPHMSPFTPSSQRVIHKPLPPPPHLQLNEESISISFMEPHCPQPNNDLITIEKSGGVAEGHDVGFLSYSGERPNPTFRVGAAYPKVTSKRGFAPNEGAPKNIKNPHTQLNTTPVTDILNNAVLTSVPPIPSTFLRAPSGRSSEYKGPSTPVSLTTSPYFSVNNQSDPLFWYMFISINGINEYQYLNGRYTNRIMEEKQKLVNFIKVNDISIKPFLKKNKITGISLKTMLSGVLSNEPVDFKNIILYCYFYKINMTFVNFDKRVYFTVCGNEEDGGNDTCMYYIEFSLKTSTPETNTSATPNIVKKYKYSILTDEDKIKQSKSYFGIDNVDKPISAMTSYKICELTEIAQQLGLLNGKDGDVKMKKNNLYKLITEYFTTIFI